MHFSGTHEIRMDRLRDMPFSPLRTCDSTWLRGKHLVHVAVVQQLTKVGKLPKGKTFAQDVQLKLKPGADLKNVRVVAFVQESGPGKLLGAALRKSSL